MLLSNAGNQEISEIKDHCLMHNALMLCEAYYLRYLSNFCFDTKAKIALDMVILLVPCAKQQGAKLKWQWQDPRL